MIGTSSGKPRTIVLLTTYPLVAPRHGGQIRSSQIVRLLRNHGANVVPIGVADAAAYRKDELGPHDIYFPTDSHYRSYHGQNVPYASDFLSGVYAANDESAYRRILAAVPQNVDVLILEQPWMQAVAQRLRVDRNVRLLIYDAQNDETLLKEPILSRYHPELCSRLLTEISNTERAACASADLIFAVSELDKESLARNHGCDIRLAPNGAEPWRASEADYERWKAIFESDVPRFALYIASAHPPNFLNFYDVVGGALGFLAPDEAICVAGGASAQLDRLLSDQDYEELARSRMRFMGVVDDHDLAAIKQLAHVFILPVLEGSGSNLKTAEALSSGSWIVSTPMAFRGFEQFVTLPNVMIAQSGKPFRDAIQFAMRRPAPLLSESARISLKAITWDRTLATLIEATLSGVRGDGST